MFQINIKKKYIMVLSVFTSVLFIISFLGLFNEYNFMKQYENALAASMGDAVNEADIGDTLVSLNEFISQKRLYYGSNRYRPNSFQWRYYTAAMAF